jgi:hypothetical protein
MTQMSADARFRAFISPRAPDVFRSVLSTSDVWQPDPLDIPEIHAEARATFDSVIERTQREQAEANDRLILMEGRAGSGKTHLLRALRNDLHERGRGFFCYMQMETDILNYGEYILKKIIESLNLPMRECSPDRALDYLARSLVQEADDDETLEDPGKLADALFNTGRFNVDPEFLRALMMIRNQEPATTARIIKYLQCLPLSDRERSALKGLAPRTNAIETIRMLADVIAATFERPLVICLDQLDEIYEGIDSAGRFQRILQRLNAVLESKNVVVVIAILDDQYAVVRPEIAAGYRDRLESGTPPVQLKGNVSAAQVEAVLAKRLAYLYEFAGTAAQPAEPLYPFARDTPTLLAGNSLRAVLRRLAAARYHSIATSVLPTVVETDRPDIESPPVRLDLTKHWNDARLTFSFDLPSDARSLFDLLAFGIERINDEFPAGWRAHLRSDVTGTFLERERPAKRCRERLAITNQAPQGGHLERAIESAAAAADALGVSAVALRSSDYPLNPRTKIFKALGVFMKAGHRSVTIGPLEWLALAAFQTFHAENTREAEYGEWIAQTKPLSSLPGLRRLFELDELLPAVAEKLAVNSIAEVNAAPVPVDAAPVDPALVATVDAALVATVDEPPAPSAVEPDPVANGRPSGAITLGVDLQGNSVSLEPGILIRHCAVLGGAGSGKTSLAFALIEALVLRGVPAILVDRKGDLACLADPDAWSRDVDAETAKRRRRLSERIDVRLYTPGAKGGRNLGIAAFPSDLSSLPPDEVDEAARSAANGLGAMLEWGPARKDRLAVLDRAIATLAATSSGPLSIDGLIEFIASQDPLLLASIGRLNPKLLENVVNDLQVLRINASRLLQPEGETVDIERLLGLDGSAIENRTRISVSVRRVSATASIRCSGSRACSSNSRALRAGGHARNCRR